MFRDGPLFILAATIVTYWSTVILLVLVRRIRTGKSAGLVPKQRFEKRLWFLTVPVIGAWMAVPTAAMFVSRGWFALPAWTYAQPAATCLRWAAALVALGCYLLSCYCWYVMGRNWSMAVVPKQQSEMVTTGLYRWVRHPIYSLSVLLMVCSALVLPSAVMVTIAGLHIIVMNLKAQNEERHLHKSFGLSYEKYCQSAGRFWPKWQGEMKRSA